MCFLCGGRVGVWAGVWAWFFGAVWAGFCATGFCAVEFGVVGFCAVGVWFCVCKVSLFVRFWRASWRGFSANCREFMATNVPNSNLAQLGQKAVVNPQDFRAPRRHCEQNRRICAAISWIFRQICTSQIRGRVLKLAKSTRLPRGFLQKSLAMTGKFEFNTLAMTARGASNSNLTTLRVFFKRTKPTRLPRGFLQKPLAMTARGAILRIVAFCLPNSRAQSAPAPATKSNPPAKSQT